MLETGAPKTPDHALRRFIAKFRRDLSLGTIEKVGGEQYSHDRVLVILDDTSCQVAESSSMTYGHIGGQHFYLADRSVDEILPQAGNEENKKWGIFLSDVVIGGMSRRNSSALGYEWKRAGPHYIIYEELNVTLIGIHALIAPRTAMSVSWSRVM